MPAKTAPTTSTNVRRARLWQVGYTVLTPRIDGSVVPTAQWAALGDEMTLSPMEEARLDALGALAPAGATRDDVVAEQEARQEAYRTVRRNAEVTY